MARLGSLDGALRAMPSLSFLRRKVSAGSGKPASLWMNDIADKDVATVGAAYPAKSIDVTKSARVEDATGKPTGKPLRVWKSCRRSHARR